MTTDVIDGHAVVEPGTDLEPVVEPARTTLFRTDDPAEVLTEASKVASALKDVLRQQGMVQNIKGREHVRVEGWQTLGSMLGVVPVVAWTRELEDGWEARVEARTLDGRVVGAAEAMCTRRESMWKSRDPYALRSMAQTRATSKALRGPLGFVVTLAGYDATPAEEMPHDAPEANQRRDVRQTGLSDATPATISNDEAGTLGDLYVKAGKPETEVAALLDELGVPKDGLKVAVSPARFRRCTHAQALKIEEFLTNAAAGAGS